jgi:hypothetical protein
MIKISYSGYRFAPEIIQQAIWLYVRFTLSFRDVEDLLAERGITVSYETVRRWVNHFGPMIDLAPSNAAGLEATIWSEEGGLGWRGSVIRLKMRRLIVARCASVSTKPSLSIVHRRWFVTRPA